MAELQLISHARRVCSLYKRGLRLLETYYHDRLAYRYQACILRKRFDDNKNVQDLRRGKLLLQQGEDELFLNQHYQPSAFPNSPGGVAYEREVTPPDWVLDYWDPMEKAAFPEYFKRREQRKLEYVDWYNKKYGKPHESEH